MRKRVMQWWVFVGNFIGVHQYLEYILCMIFLKFILLILVHYLYIPLMLASFELIIRHICNISGAYFIMIGYSFTNYFFWEDLFVWISNLYWKWTDILGRWCTMEAVLTLGRFNDTTDGELSLVTQNPWMVTHALWVKVNVCLCASQDFIMVISVTPCEPLLCVWGTCSHWCRLHQLG